MGCEPETRRVSGRSGHQMMRAKRLVTDFRDKESACTGHLTWDTVSRTVALLGMVGGMKRGKEWHRVWLETQEGPVRLPEGASGLAGCRQLEIACKEAGWAQCHGHSVQSTVFSIS